VFAASKQPGSPSMVEFQREFHLDTRPGEDIARVARLGHVITTALYGKFRASRQPACEHAYACTLEALREVSDFALICIAGLHDVLEEGNNVNAEILTEYFGIEIAMAVIALTKIKRGKLSQHEAMVLYVAQMRSSNNWRVIFAKLLDCWHNVLTADDFIVNATSNAERRRANCYRKTRDYYLPMFRDCRALILVEHLDAYDKLVAEIDRISAKGLSVDQLELPIPAATSAIA